MKPDGNFRDHYRYDKFGKPAPGNSKLSPDGAINLNNTFGYTGEMWDEESDLLYLRARYYEPETGRFLSRDTYEGELRNPLSKNLYSYVQNNPVNFTDPTGHQRQKFILDAINYNHAIIVKLGGQFNKTKDPTMKALFNIQADELRIQNLQMLYWTSSSETEQTKLQSQINGIRRNHGWGWPDTQYFTPDGPGKRGNHRVTEREVAKWRTSKDKEHFPDKGTGKATLLLSNSLPTKGEPNSTGRLYNPDGTVKQERKYGPDGRAEKDTDYNHPGDNHEFPHEHDWDWNKTPPRQPGKPVPTPIGNDVSTAAGWATAGAVTYWIISEGSRILFPPRNLIPVL